MTPERWKQITDLLHAALEREPEERAAFLDQACAGDPDLRQQLEALLAADAQATNFLEEPAIVAHGDSLWREEETPLPADDQPDSLVGQRIGSYQILDEISRGGMGVVYLARRADREYQKQVAIKIVKRGVDTDAIVRRFRRERQILASLDHPNIAKLLDGGTTDDGLPYFVMDYVDGLPIDVYADRQKLSIQERLKLFRTVCSAVHYAHQHRVIHRDLKPSNILVTAEGVPKLLDFGIAKVLDPELYAQTVESTMLVRPMTPEYASPEQVRGEPVTPASDVYSLGVLLYELLTGRRPYRLTGRSLSELERAICEQEPEKPSLFVVRGPWQRKNNNGQRTTDNGQSCASNSLVIWMPLCSRRCARNRRSGMPRWRRSPRTSDGIWKASRCWPAEARSAIERPSSSGETRSA